MNRQLLSEAIAMAQRLGHYFIATSDGRGQPHVAAANRLEGKPGGLVAVVGWFCPGTVENVDANRPVSLVVWEKQADEGFQILGDVEDVEEIAIMDGYIPQAERMAGPQEEFSLHVRVRKVLRFRQGRHTDQEE
jgi:hypothetical protein